ncbi:MAG: ATP-dependent DNA ligase [Candidatus Hydrothermarchaeaceae archaeon]
MKFSALAAGFERLEATTKRLEMFDILADIFRESSAEEIAEVIYLLQGQLLPPYKGVEMGMSEKLLMRAISNASGVDVREVEGHFKESGDLGKTAESLMEGEGVGLSVAEVFGYLMDIARASGEGSVERKVHSLAELLSKASRKGRKYIARFVIGRLRLGVGDPTVMEGLCIAKSDRGFRPELERAYNLCSDLGHVAEKLFREGEDGVRGIKVQVGYPIRMALCERLPSAEEIVKKIGRCGVEAKYDGFRTQVHKDGDDVEIFSRNLERTTPMFPEIAAAARRLRAKTAIFEGEALAYNESTGELLPFQVTVQRKRKHGVEEMAKEYPLKLFAFDLLYLDGVDYTKRPFQERRDKLEELISDEVIAPSDIIVTEDPKEVKEYFEEEVERGLEGIVAKRLDAPYSAGARNFNWIKLKRSYRGELADTIDLCIVGYFRGRGLRAKFGIGAVLGAVYDPKEDSFKTVSKVGSGFTEEGWVELRGTLDEIALDHKPARVDSLVEPDVWVEPRYVITVTADEITRSPMHTAGKTETESGYALRFPRAQGEIRGDKRAEDANTVDEIIEMFNLQRRVEA